MKTAPPYRLILAGVGVLALGWALGFLMSGSSDPIAGGGPLKLSTVAESAAASEAKPWGRALPSATIAEDGAPGSSLFGGSAGVPADFEKLMRGALRLTDNTDRMVRLREVARSISLADLPAAVEKAKRLPTSEGWQVLHALGARWAEEAPAAAAAFAVKQGANRHGWNQLLSGAIDKWASIDQQAATIWIGTQPEGRRQALLQTLIQSLSRRDPEGALQVMKAQPETSQMSWLHQQVFEHWSQRDPAAAAKGAESMAAGASRERAMQAVASSWAAQDPAAAMKWADSFPDKNQQNSLRRSVAQAWTEQEPLAVIQWAGTLTEPGIRQEILSTAISQLAQSDLGAAQSQLRALPPGQERDNLVTRVAYAAANLDAKAALAFVELLPAGPARATATASMVSRIAASDPETAAKIFATLPPAQLSAHTGQFAASLASGNMEFAREWADGMADPQTRSQAMRAIAGVLARGNPRSAAEWLMEKEPAADVTWLVNGWVRNAPKDVLEWSKTLPDGDAKRSAQVAVVQNLAFADLSQARLAFANDLSPEAQIASATQLASQWAGRDVSAARAWAESLPAGGARENALGGIARAWATQDAAAATQWLEGFAPGDERDRVVTHFAGAAVQRDPGGALAWATSIGDPDLRGAQLEQLAGRWLQTDSAAARQWINNSEHLSPSARRRVLEQRGQNYQVNYGSYYD